MEHSKHGPDQTDRRTTIKTDRADRRDARTLPAALKFRTPPFCGWATRHAGQTETAGDP